MSAETLQRRSTEQPLLNITPKAVMGLLKGLSPKEEEKVRMIIRRGVDAGTIKIVPDPEAIRPEGVSYPNPKPLHHSPASGEPSERSKKKSLTDILVSFSPITIRARLREIHTRAKEIEGQIIAEGNLRQLGEAGRLVKLIKENPEVQQLIQAELNAILLGEPFDPSNAAHLRALDQAIARAQARHLLTQPLEEAEIKAANDQGKIYQMTELGMRFDPMVLQQIEAAIGQLQKANSRLPDLVRETNTYNDYMANATRAKFLRYGLVFTSAIAGLGGGFVGGGVSIFTSTVGYAGKVAEEMAKKFPLTTIGLLVGAGLVGILHVSNNPSEVNELLLNSRFWQEAAIGAAIGALGLPAVVGIGKAAIRHLIYKED